MYKQVPGNPNIYFNNMTETAKEIGCSKVALSNAFRKSKGNATVVKGFAVSLVK